MENSNKPYAHITPKIFLPDRDEVLGKRKRGRPGGSLNEKTIWKKVLAKKHTLKETGESRTILEWVILTLKKLVAEGDFNAIAVHDQFFGPIYDPALATDGSGGILLVPEALSAEEWIAEMEAQNDYINRIRKEVIQEMGSV